MEAAILQLQDVYGGTRVEGHSATEQHPVFDHFLKRISLMPSPIMPQMSAPDLGVLVTAAPTVLTVEYSFLLDLI